MLLDQTNTLKINIDRLWSTITASAAIGPGKKSGLSRLTLSDADKTMRDLFVSWCKEAGCEVKVDRVGNIFARREGTSPELDPMQAPNCGAIWRGSGAGRWRL